MCITIPRSPGSREQNARSLLANYNYIGRLHFALCTLLIEEDIYAQHFSKMQSTAAWPRNFFSSCEAAELKEQSWNVLQLCLQQITPNPACCRAGADTRNYCTLPKSSCTLISPSSLGRLAAFIPFIPFILFIPCSLLAGVRWE